MARNRIGNRDNLGESESLKNFGIVPSLVSFIFLNIAHVFTLIFLNKT